MKKFLKPIFFVFTITLAGIQFIPTSINSDDTTTSEDFLSLYVPSDSIATFFKNACYDCHSNNTKYPWYNKIQPIGLLMEDHIKEAKEELNLSEFGKISANKQQHKIKEMLEEIEEDEMPLTSYKLMHKEAEISASQKEQVLAWLKSL